MARFNADGTLDSTFGGAGRSVVTSRPYRAYDVRFNRTARSSLSVGRSGFGIRVAIALQYRRNSGLGLRRRDGSRRLIFPEPDMRAPKRNPPTGRKILVPAGHVAELRLLVGPRAVQYRWKFRHRRFDGDGLPSSKQNSRSRFNATNVVALQSDGKIVVAAGYGPLSRRRTCTTHRHAQRHGRRRSETGANNLQLLSSQRPHRPAVDRFVSVAE